ncbi:MAG: hypothetical protein PHO07_13615 [Pirellulales bacterium]|jgi:hypothetical protein|nr:hypothetical protein [Pirellulales bacterium]NLZ02326.1 FMN-binding glutamate synthase family protein [Pirellulaceae bacterium]
MGRLQRPHGADMTQAGDRSREVARGGESRPARCSQLINRGTARGGEGVSAGLAASGDGCPVPPTGTETSYGWDRQVKLAMPVISEALGPMETGQEDWEPLAVAAALAGVTLVCGAELCRPGPQPDARGKIVHWPGIDRAVRAYNTHQGDYGELLVQVSIDDARRGAAEYLIEKHGLESLELRWGRGANRIGGEAAIASLDRALELNRCGQTVTPNPTADAVQAAFRRGALKQFGRHGRLGLIDEEGFLAECDRLRGLGFQRIALKAEIYELRELALAMTWAGQARIDLLSIGGGPAGSGTRPARIAPAGSLPASRLHAAAVEFAGRLAAEGRPVPDLALAGPLSAEGDIFKTVALGAPYVKAVRLCPAMIRPAIAGKTVGRWAGQGDWPRIRFA